MVQVSRQEWETMKGMCSDFVFCLAHVEALQKKLFEIFPAGTFTGEKEPSQMEVISIIGKNWKKMKNIVPEIGHHIQELNPKYMKYQPLIKQLADGNSERPTSGLHQ